MSNSENCGNIFYQLLVSLRPTVSASGAEVLREFQQTQRCDEYHDMKEVRKNLDDQIANPERKLELKFLKETPEEQKMRLQRIHKYEETEKDAAIANQMLKHYSEYIRPELDTALLYNFTRTWAYYHFWAVPVDTLALFGIVSSPFATYKAFRFIKGGGGKTVLNTVRKAN